MNIATSHYAPPRLSAEAVAMIKYFEGCFLKAYRDPVGVTTIGYGHTAHVRRGMAITPEDAEDLLMEDLDVAAADVRRAVSVSLNDNEFGALVSLAFNIGGSALRRSTLLRKLNKGDRRAAAKEFCRFVYGHVGWRRMKLKGLVLRREAEREMFEASVGQLVRDGKMVLAGRTIPVDHPSHDLAYAGPPQPPQPYQGPANPSLMRASADDDADAAAGERRMTRKTLATIGAGAAVGAIPATDTPAAHSLMQLVGEIWQKAGGGDVLPGGTAWMRWIEAFASGTGRIVHQGDLKPLLDYLVGFIHSNEAVIVFIATLALVLIRAGAGSFLFDRDPARKA